jgi:hypothetical protein
LIEILEYTRAFLKKTWRLANQGSPDKGDRTKQVAIANDIEYAAENLELIRDDPRYEFDGTDIKDIKGVLDDYELARTELLAKQVEKAIPPETRAYRTLRRLVDDIVQRDIKGGSAVSKDKPDKVELKEVQHLTRLERERVARQLKTLNQRLTEVAREQETISRTFLHFLDDPQKQDKQAKVNDEKSWITDGSPSDQAGQRSSQGAAGPGSMQDRTVEGALAPPSGAISGLMPTNFTEIMKVLRAQQKQLRAELAMLEEQLAAMPIGLNQDSNKPSPIETRKAARNHIEQAKDAMDRFETFLAEQYYNQHDPNQLALEAPAMLGAISLELMMARQAMQQEAGSYMDDDAERLRQMALNLQDMANAYNNALTQEQRDQLLNNMAAATAQLNSMFSVGPPDNTNVGGNRSGQPSGPVFTVKSDYQDIIDAARFTARQFLSKDIQATGLTGTRVGRDSGGSLRFYEQENDFFESAADNR